MKRLLIPLLLLICIGSAGANPRRAVLYDVPADTLTLPQSRVTVTPGHLETGSIRAADGTTAATIDTGTGAVVVTSRLSVPRDDLGTDNEIIGSAAGFNAPGDNNSFFGRFAGQESTGSRNIGLGTRAGVLTAGNVRIYTLTGDDNSYIRYDDGDITQIP